MSKSPNRALNRALKRLAYCEPRRLRRYLQLAAVIRQHGCPARLVVGRKTGRVMIRAGVSVGYDREVVKCSQHNSWKIELVRPDTQSVRDFLGY